MELEDTPFFRPSRLRRLRHAIAVCVVGFYFGKFFYHIAIDAYYVSQNGPFARSSAFVFGLDDLVTALIPAAILFSELEIVAKPKTYHLLRSVCLIVGVIGGLGALLFLREIAHKLDYAHFKIGLLAFILRQILIVSAAIYLYHRIKNREAEADKLNA